MSKDLTDYRASLSEQQRISNLFSLLPDGYGAFALDIGARDGYLSMRLCNYFDFVTALDLEKPQINHPNIKSVQGNINDLEFDDNTFDLVLCAEVLEHIPTTSLEKACAEISRVARHAVLIGVPYRQDLRYGRTTCQTCGLGNPPYGHINSFNEVRLRNLFPKLIWQKHSFVGLNHFETNWLSTILLDYAGNPFGTYDQDEPCIYCHSTIGIPKPRNILQKVATRMAFLINSIQVRCISQKPNWIHVLFKKVPPQ